MRNTKYIGRKSTLTEMCLSKRALNLTTLQTHRFFSSSSTLIAQKKKKKSPFWYIRLDYRPQFIAEAQNSIRAYLRHNTSLPFLYADQIAANAPFCLSGLFRQTRFSALTFKSDIRNSLRYGSLNEFELFFESIGIDYEHVPLYLPPKKLLFAEDSSVLDASRELYRFGFPWNMLGKLYVEESSIFRTPAGEIEGRLCRLKRRFGRDDSLYVVGLCLAFPCLLGSEGEFGSGIDGIFDTVKRVFVDSGVESGVEGNVDTWYECCCKVRFFYDLGCERGEVGELMREKKEGFVKCSIDDLVKKFVYFSRFGAGMLDVGMFLLRSPEILSLDLETPVISVLGFLEHFELDREELKCVREKYPYVFGTNELVNLPGVMKALDLHKWCFDQIKHSNGRLLATYLINFLSEGVVDNSFSDGWKKIESSNFVNHVRRKLNFLKGIGYGENEVTIKMLSSLAGNGIQLDDKFNFLIRIGIKHADVCYMLRRNPHLLSQSMEKLEKKTNYLLHEMEYSVDFVVNYPKFYSLEFETRVKPRHRFYVWLKEKGWHPKHTMFGMLHITEKEFIRRVYHIHPGAPKHYLACF